MVVRNATVATFMMAPLLHGWYRAMAIWSKGAMTWRWSMKITTVEQLVFGPVMISTFFIGSGKYSLQICQLFDQIVLAVL